jgi:hypothetical protein
MTRSHITRSTATVLTAAVALGAAGSAAAEPIGWNGPILVAPATPAHYDKANVLPPYRGIRVHHYGKANVLPPFAGLPAARHTTPAPRPVVNHPEGGGSSDLVYILVGGVLVALSGLGGTLAVAGRRRAAPARARIAG